MINHSQRHAPKQDPSHWIEKADEPCHVFFAVDPDEDVASRSRGPYQSSERRFRFLEMVDDTNRKRDVKYVFLKDVIDGLTADLDGRMSLEIGPRNIE